MYSNEGGGCAKGDRGCVMDLVEINLRSRVCSGGVDFDDSLARDSAPEMVERAARHMELTPYDQRPSPVADPPNVPYSQEFLHGLPRYLVLGDSHASVWEIGHHCQNMARFTVESARCECQK